MLLNLGRTKTHNVPYYVQPTTVQCQSTVLRMYAVYFVKSVTLRSTGVGSRAISEIWKDINQSPERPNKSAQNHHENMLWWLNK